MIVHSKISANSKLKGSCDNWNRYWEDYAIIAYVYFLVLEIEFDKSEKLKIKTQNQKKMKHFGECKIIFKFDIKMKEITQKELIFFF